MHGLGPRTLLGAHSELSFLDWWTRKRTAFPPCALRLRPRSVTGSSLPTSKSTPSQERSSEKGSADVGSGVGAGVGTGVGASVGWDVGSCSREEGGESVRWGIAFQWVAKGTSLHTLHAPGSVAAGL